MTRHPLLWITACAVTMGAATATPMAVGAQAELVWRVTIDPMGEDGVVDTKHLVITGDASFVAGLPVDEVTVTAVPGPSLPAECGTARSGTSPVSNGRYGVVLDVDCNGPYEIQAVAREGREASPPATLAIGVGEAPAPPALPPGTESLTGGALRVSWPASEDVDADGWIVLVDGVATAVGPEILELDVRGRQDGTMLALKAVRWGPGGPDVDQMASEESPGVIVDPEVDPPDEEPPPPPDTDPPGTDPDPGPNGTTPPAGTSPPSTSGSTPTPGTGSTAPPPEGFTEELPYGAPDDAFIPEDRVAVASSETDRDQIAAGTSPSAGLVRTSEKRSPGLVAPFALALLLFTIAAHITWYLRRSKPTDGGQVTLL
ncbi:MAG TPA: hypothetical protein VF228_18535 [Iamia sp.]